MGGNIGKPTSSKEGSEKTELSSNFPQRPDDISTGGECTKSVSVEKQMFSVTQTFENSGLVEQCIMIVLYDFAATLDSQLTVKRGWGQYGDVYEALWKRYNSIVAVKTLKQDVDLNLNDFLAEASIMKNLQHKNLVRLLGES
ncbi:unnamed protein product [Taenia asiatica]|uniref:Non-specific protein-tyrosine kinase n=1 Tax=Taenia asiatica TaxID=60517 RepID=A0A0R3VUB3_TAEAS|nr:unnamed protein product [Taenia asiatica]